MLLASFVLSAILGSDPIAAASEKIVKLYGGGIGRVEAYGTGTLVSSDGHVLTSLSAMLNVDAVQAVLWDGRRRTAKLIHADPASGWAVLKVEAQRLPHFDLATSASIQAGDVIYALSNQFNIAAGDERASLQKGIVSAKMDLVGRLGLRDETRVKNAIVVDASMANPGSAGGAIVNRQGKLVGIIGREIKSPTTDTWIHYGVPAESLLPIVKAAFEGKPQLQTNPPPRMEARGTLRGIVLLPDWLDKTPPFVDGVIAGSAAEQAGLRSDDLIVFVDGKVVESAKDLQAKLLHTDPAKDVVVVVERDGNLFTLTMKP